MSREKTFQFVSLMAIAALLVVAMTTVLPHPAINFTAVSHWVQTWLASNSDYPDLAGSLQKGEHTEKTVAGTTIMVRTWTEMKGCNVLFQLQVGMIEVQFPEFRAGGPCTVDDVKSLWEQFKQHLRDFADGKLHLWDMPETEAAISLMDPYIGALTPIIP